MPKNLEANILIVDDEKNIREGLKQALIYDHHTIFLAEDGIRALDVLEQEDIDVVITDLKMPNLSGQELMKKILKLDQTIPVIVLTGHGTIENAVAAMREGAYDFLTKPINIDKLGLIVKRALTKRKLTIENRMLHDQLERSSRYENVIGRSAKLTAIFDIIDQVASTKSSILILGENGVGKERIADAIHYNSNRKNKPFVKVHCAALTETLLESELFGHEKGSFTGAIKRRLGRFEMADEGTIFLDEIGELSQNIQIKLLRVLQEKEFERVGGEETTKVDVRIIAATNRDLKKEVENSNFREDLYYRLNVVTIEIPPLRERKEDIPLLINYFIKEINNENNKNITGIHPKARAAIYSYDWPGNIRELRNCIESAVVLSKSNTITLDDLPANIVEPEEESVLKIPIPIKMEEAERKLIYATLKSTGGNKSKAAQLLNIGRKTFHRKIKQYTDEDSQEGLE